MASIGHVIDLPTRELGVDIKNGFAPKYTVIQGKKPVLDALRSRPGRRGRFTWRRPRPRG